MRFLATHASVLVGMYIGLHLKSERQDRQIANFPFYLFFYSRRLMDSHRPESYEVSTTSFYPYLTSHKDNYS